MFNKKIICLLLAALPMQVLAGDTQLLVDRAHYWNKQGRSDMARQVWEEVLRIEPDNAEALAAVSQPAAPVQVEPVAQDTSGNVPVIEPAPAVDATPVFAHASIVKAAPFVEASPVVEAAPVIEAAPVVKAAPAIEVVPAIEAAPVTEPAFETPVIADAPIAAPFVEASPVVEAAPVIEAAPVVKAAPAIEVVPAIEAAPVTEPAVETPVIADATIVKAAPFVEATPVVEAAPVIEAAPVTESVPVAAVETPVAAASTIAAPFVEAAVEVPVVKEPAAVPAILAEPAAATPVPEVRAAAESVDSGLSDKQVLIDRAHYWEKQGRADMSAIEWQNLLVLEPDNAEALAALSQADVARKTEPVAQPEQKITQPVQPEVISARETGLPKEPVKPQPGEIRLVEDWADLYQGGAEAVQVNQEPKTEPVSRQTELFVQPVVNEQAALMAAPVKKIAPETRIAPEKTAIPEPVKSAIKITPEPVAKPAEVKKYAEIRPVEKAAWMTTSSAPKSETKEIITQGGPLQISDKPSQQELIDRAKYWESRGRSDLAQKFRNQYKQEGASSVPAGAAYRAAKPVSESSAPVAKTAVASSSQAVVPEKPIMRQTAPVPQAAVVQSEQGAQAKPTRQELDDNAQYWEAHGRNDLAAQIRQKLDSGSKTITGSARTTEGTSRTRADKQSAPRISEDTTALEDALLKSPGSMKIRLDLAQIYRSAGEMSKARLQIESLLAASPDLPEALFASAQLYADQRMWLESMHTLERVAPVSRTPEMGKLQKMGWAHLQLDRADALVRQGKSAEAEVLLRQVATELAVNYNQTKLPEPPPLWKSEAPKVQKSKR